MFYSTIELIPTSKSPLDSTESDDLPLQREGIIKHYDLILLFCQNAII
jgi:hypothetical protein